MIDVSAVGRWFRSRYDRDRAGPTDLDGQASAEAVRWTYRAILGREPESRAVIDEKIAAGLTIRELREVLLASDELRSTTAGMFSLPMSGHEPPMYIEGLPAGVGADLEPLFARVRDTWQLFGEFEPHWSVWSDDRFKAATYSDHSDEFDASGKVHLNLLQRTLERSAVSWADLETCLELGCGVGRMTRWLARTFDRVVALDVSASHLEIARNVLARDGITNVELQRLTAPESFVSLPEADLVYSVVVLQHNPPPLIDLMVQGLLRALKPGGIACFQVPTYRLGYRFSVSDYLATVPSREDLEMHVLPQQRVLEIAQGQACDVLEVLDDGWTYPRKGERSNTFVIRRPPG
jgi:SAM-dependent methyltransferase